MTETRLQQVSVAISDVVLLYLASHPDALERSIRNTKAFKTWDLDRITQELAAKRGAKEQDYDQKQRDEPDEGDYPESSDTSVFNHGTGGGRRIIRSGKPFT